MKYFLLLLLLPLEVLTVNVCFAAQNVKAVRKKKKKRKNANLARNIKKNISPKIQELNLLLKDLTLEMNTIKKDIISLRTKIKKTNKKRKRKRKKLQKKLNKKLKNRKLLNLKIKAIKKDLKVINKSDTNFAQMPPDVTIVDKEDYIDLYIQDYRKGDSSIPIRNEINNNINLNSNGHSVKKNDYTIEKDIVKKEKGLTDFLNATNIPKAQKETLILLVKQIGLFSKGNKPELKKYLHNNIINSIYKIATMREDIEKNIKKRVVQKPIVSAKKNIKKRVVQKPIVSVKKNIKKRVVRKPIVSAKKNIKKRVVQKPIVSAKKDIYYGLQIGVYKNLDLYGTYNKKEKKIFLRQDIDGNMYKYTIGLFKTFEAAVKFRKILKKMGLFSKNPDIVPFKEDEIIDYDKSIEEHIREHKTGIVNQR